MPKINNFVPTNRAKLDDDDDPTKPAVKRCAVKPCGGPVRARKRTICGECLRAYELSPIVMLADFIPTRARELKTRKTGLKRSSPTPKTHPPEKSPL